MKHLLLASTMLVASVTIAQAQGLAISGEGRMGLEYNVSGTSDWEIENRLRLDFTATVEADHGLTFGAWSRAQMASATPGVAQAGGFSPARVWVEASNLRLTFGNSDGAIASFGYSHGWMGGCGVGYEGGIMCWDAGDLLSVAQQQTDAAVAHAAPQAMVSYSGGSYNIAISRLDGVSTEVAGNFTSGAFSIGAGYSDVDAGTDAWTISAHYDGGSYGVGVLFADVNGFNNWSLSATAALGGGTAYGYVGEIAGDTAYGLSYSYDLGGGAAMVAGAERLESAVPATVGSVGDVFTF